MGQFWPPVPGARVLAHPSPAAGVGPVSVTVKRQGDVVQVAGTFSTTSAIGAFTQLLTGLPSATLTNVVFYLNTGEFVTGRVSGTSLSTASLGIASGRTVAFGVVYITTDP